MAEWKLNNWSLEATPTIIRELSDFYDIDPGAWSYDREKTALVSKLRQMKHPFAVRNLIMGVEGEDNSMGVSILKNDPALKYLGRQ